jgi:2-polyprenyl-3-methyl-5-hydroxy-6-metoxy-1,4-benzoquinol methylase
MARGNDGTVSIAARLEAIRSKTRASEERMDAVLRSIEEVRSEVKDHVAATQRDLAERVQTAERKSVEIEARLLDMQQGEHGLQSQVSTAVDLMKTGLDRHMQELGRELAGRLESMQRSEQEVEGRVKCFEAIGDRLKAMISATESVGPQLRELLGAVDDMRTNLGVSIDAIGTVRDDVQGSIATLTKAQADLGARLTLLETGLSEARAELAASAGRLSKEQENALQSALAPIDRRATEARQLSVLAPGDFPYFRFEDLHRGSAEAVRDLIRPLVRNFVRCQMVVDLGCGRGEFLDLCVQEGIGAYGVDSNEDMVLHCQRIGLDVVRDDIVDHLRGLKEKSVDGVFCSQVVEHLPMLKVQALLRECFRVLKVGTHMVLVTINPLSLYALANNFYLDPTHVRPLPPETMRFLAEDAGFRKLSVSYFSPFGPDYTLLPVRFEQESEEQRAIRVNFDRLNHVVFGNQEYALIGLK